MKLFASPTVCHIPHSDNNDERMFSALRHSKLPMPGILDTLLRLSVFANWSVIEFMAVCCAASAQLL